MSAAYKMPAIERVSVNGIQQISLVTDLFTNRKIFLFGEIDEATVYAFTMQLMSLMEEPSCQAGMGV